ncbi:MAG: DUF3574 domain-containing protein [Lachnospiraceae bacterium]|nr:DUF3574 domain-containing protein [Lachnospiraceae bacterium]
MNKRVVCILAGIAACLSLTACNGANLEQAMELLDQRIDQRIESALSERGLTEEEAHDVQYVMYLGTNDKDTGEPVYPPEEAVEKAKAILIDRVGGYTIQEANGGWIGDDGMIYQEYTIVIYLSDIDKQTVHEVADEMIKEFNQSTVLIQENTTKTEFYSGADTE